MSVEIQIHFKYPGCGGTPRTGMPNRPLEVDSTERGRKNKKLRVWYIAAVLNLALSEILIIVSQFTDWVYFVDENTMYHRGEFFWLSSMLACVSLISNIIVILLHKKHLSRKESIVLELYIYGGCQYRIASGMAYLGIDGDTYEEIFQVADNRMYRNKAELKRACLNDKDDHNQ